MIAACKVVWYDECKNDFVTDHIFLDNVDNVKEVGERLDNLYGHELESVGEIVFYDIPAMIVSDDKTYEALKKHFNEV